MTENSTGWTTDDIMKASAIEPCGQGKYRINVPEGWYQGRGACGTLVFATLCRALEAGEPDKERSLRSFSAAISAPVEKGPAEINVATLRRGTGISMIAAILHRDNNPLVQATAIFGKARADKRRLNLIKPPEPIDWKSLDVLPLKFPVAPEFTQFLEFRNLGPFPFSGSTEPLTEGFVRYKITPPKLGAPEIAGLTDSFWPTILAIETEPRPTATIAFTLQVFKPVEPLDPAIPLRYRARAIAGEEGYVLEMRELWTPSGELVALNEQTFAVIK
jgi:hypothetical protein